MSLASRGITYLSKVCQYGFSRWYLRKSQIFAGFRRGKVWCCSLLATLVLVALDDGEGAGVLVVLHHEPFGGK